MAPFLLLAVYDRRSVLTIDQFISFLSGAFSDRCARELSRNLTEVGQCFAVVAMAAMTSLGLPHDKVNVNGGACALGHPIGASGARILVTLLHAMRARDVKRGMAAICIGGGEATAIGLELMDTAQ